MVTIVAFELGLEERQVVVGVVDGSHHIGGIERGSGHVSRVGSGGMGGVGRRRRRRSRSGKGRAG